MRPSLYATIEGRKATFIRATFVRSLQNDVSIFGLPTKSSSANPLPHSQFARLAERNMTAYFAHELRNPLHAIDIALSVMPAVLDPVVKDLTESMTLCTQFMSSIMNNLLDVRKMEEGKVSERNRCRCGERRGVTNGEERSDDEERGDLLLNSASRCSLNNFRWPLRGVRNGRSN